jgi:hypothetical protein
MCIRLVYKHHKRYYKSSKLKIILQDVYPAWSQQKTDGILNLGNLRVFN